ncbi:YdcF family protein [Stappia sp. GBMRC 2046]|uniref:YdcF family protein n=1 Tax=Stappia sediminis TaxID=2692190 RepID=A0A7X3S6Q3_9HYPH|nr:YdcF family protein [Stappia sediminis]MXN64127.1 YdcF family protein [Stappia sediminis]
MFAIVSKAAFFLLRPSNLLVVVLLAGLGFSLLRLRRVGRVLIVLSATGFLVGGFSPLANWLILPLEQRFAAPDPMPERVDGIVVLGGAIDTLASAARPYPGIERPAERLMVVPRLANQYPTARILLSGGTGGRTEDQSESALARDILVELGVPASRITVEGRSLNTWQNAGNAIDVAKPQHGQTWLLITSAAHMPRAIGAFRQAGWVDIVAYPVDWETSGTDDRSRWFRSASMGLTRLDQAVREWLGLAAYALTGRSSAFFPGP